MSAFKDHPPPEYSLPFKILNHIYTDLFPYKVTFPGSRKQGLIIFSYHRDNPTSLLGLERGSE
jgi:hypothetical protein